MALDISVDIRGGKDGAVLSLFSWFSVFPLQTPNGRYPLQNSAITYNIPNRKQRIGRDLSGLTVAQSRRATLDDLNAKATFESEHQSLESGT